ncbi:MAG TPA: T9SS type A sorting domain-containing protein [bacterium]
MKTTISLTIALILLALPSVAQPLGDTLVIGDTWREIQHRGAPAPTADIGQDGNIHFVWQDGSHVWYNAVDSGGTVIFPGGTQIILEHAGASVLDLYHQTTLAIACHSYIESYFGSAIYFYPLGTINPIVQPMPWYGSEALISPRFRWDQQDRIHVFSRSYSASAGDPEALSYISAVYDSLSFFIDFDSTWDFVDSTIGLTYELAASRVSDRLAFGWTTPHDDHWNYEPSQIDNDLMILIDDDGQDLHFDDAFNFTSFLDPDPMWLPDTTLANTDTFRVHDFSVMFDNDNYFHVVFTTRSFFEIQGTSYWHSSVIWHWTDQFPYDMSVIHNAFDDWWEEYEMFSNVYCGDWNVKAQRPTLAQDPETGHLYCVYQVYDCDTTHLSAFIGSSGWGMPSGEVYASVSADGGLNWSVGTNITQTITQQNAPSGQCWSEVCPYPTGITNGYLHLHYVLDKDAGDYIFTEGNATLNPVIYHKVPVDSIPTTPLVPQDIFLHVSWVGVESPVASHIPTSFRLLPPHPNPFNSSTVLSFQLPVASLVKLEVFDIKGQRVGVGPDPTRYNAGSHQVPFDGSDLPSGIYLARLTAGDFQQTQKLVLMK